MKTGTRVRRMAAIAAGATASLLIASSAFAMDCVNISKADQSAGVQVVLDFTTGAIEWTTPGVAKRLENGVLSEDGEGFHGLIGFDFDGLSDGVVDVDVSTWVGVGPDGLELPQVARTRRTGADVRLDIDHVLDRQLPVVE